MIVEILPKIGGAPLRLEASQVLVLNEQGTPVAIAGEYGPQGGIMAAHAGDQQDFNRALRTFGYGRHQIITERISPSRPPVGAKLLNPTV